MLATTLDSTVRRLEVEGMWAVSQGQFWWFARQGSAEAWPKIPATGRFGAFGERRPPILGAVGRLGLLPRVHLLAADSPEG